MNRQAKWYKQIGGDFGCVKLGRHWFWYDCLLCARSQFPLQFATSRWQGPPSKAIIKAALERTEFRIPCCGPEKHKEILARKLQ